MQESAAAAMGRLVSAFPAPTNCIMTAVFCPKAFLAFRLITLDELVSKHVLTGHIVWNESPGKIPAGGTMTPQWTVQVVSHLNSCSDGSTRSSACASTQPAVRSVTIALQSSMLRLDTKLDGGDEVVAAVGADVAVAAAAVAVGKAVGDAVGNGVVGNAVGNGVVGNAVGNAVGNEVGIS